MTDKTTHPERIIYASPESFEISELLLLNMLASSGDIDPGIEDPWGNY